MMAALLPDGTYCECPCNVCESIEQHCAECRTINNAPIEPGLDVVDSFDRSNEQLGPADIPDGAIDTFVPIAAPEPGGVVLPGHPSWGSAPVIETIPHEYAAEVTVIGPSVPLDGTYTDDELRASPYAGLFDDGGIVVGRGTLATPAQDEEIMGP